MRLLIRTLPWLLPFCAEAQLLVNNGAVLTCAPAATISVNGALRNQGASGLLDNNGTIALSGDFIHDAPNTCFGASQGRVLMNGGAQAITGSSSAVFNELVLAGTGDKTLMRDTEVGGAYASPAGNIQLNDRTLILNSHALTVRNAAPSGIQRTSGFIQSETDPLAGYSFVQWNIGDAPANAYVIPFGSGASGHYLPFTATITAPGAGATGRLRMATYPTVTLASPNNRPLPTGMPNLIDVSGMENAPNVLDRWWIMESVDYSAPPVATTQFTYRDSEWSTGTNTIVEGALQLERQAGVWTMMPTVVNIAGNTLTASGQALVTSSWTAAEQSSPLPVELLSFTGERMNDREVKLDWSTASENMNAGFEVWRMIDGEDIFKEVGWVDGAGDSQAMVAYAHVDDNATTLVSYYQLRQVDHDGTFKWSPMIAVQGAGAAAEMLAYPNPATDFVRLSGVPEDALGVDLLDASGRLVRSFPTGTMVLEGLGDLERGSYTLVVSGGDGARRSVRLIMQ